MQGLAAAVEPESGRVGGDGEEGEGGVELIRRVGAYVERICGKAR